jgi:hypothetical protein
VGFRQVARGTESKVGEGGVISTWPPSDPSCAASRPVGLAELHGQRALRLPLLSEDQRRTEAQLGAAIAIEHARIACPTDARETAAYANTVLDNCRALASDDLRGYLPLVRKHLMWNAVAACGFSANSVAT